MQGFEELRTRYALSLPGKADELEGAWSAFLAAPADPASGSALHQGVHRLSGSAPAYGFDRVGAAAQRVDAVMSEWLATPEFARLPSDTVIAAVRDRIAELLAALRESHDD